MTDHDKENCPTCSDLDRLKNATREQLEEWVMCAETGEAWAKEKRKEAEAERDARIKDLGRVSVLFLKAEAVVKALDVYETGLRITGAFGQTGSAEELAKLETKLWEALAEYRKLSRLEALEKERGEK